MSAIVMAMIEILVAGITGIATGIGGGLQTLATSIFLTESNGSYSLSVFGGLICAFGGIALAVGLSRWVVNWVTSLGR